MSLSELKILTYNVHKGFTLGNRRFVLDEIKQSLELTNADILFLQEVVGKSRHKHKDLNDWPFDNHFDYLASSKWHYAAYGKNAIRKKGDHGNAILSRYPIVEHCNVNLSTNRLESRGMLHAQVKLPNEQMIDIFNVHLNLLHGGRIRQVETISNYIREHLDESRPFILAGDFNDWRTQLNDLLERNFNLKEAFKVLEGNHARTFPSFGPQVPLDRIYYRSLKLKSAEVISGPPWDSLSDHLALSAIFDFGKSA